MANDKPISSTRVAEFFEAIPGHPERFRDRMLHWMQSADHLAGRVASGSSIYEEQAVFIVRLAHPFGSPSTIRRSDHVGCGAGHRRLSRTASRGDAREADRRNQGAFDFTHCGELGVTIAGVHFVHLMFQFVLAWSGWRYVSIAMGETYEALVSGLQGAFWALGGVPARVRQDNLSAATHELVETGGLALAPRRSLHR